MTTQVQLPVYVYNDFFINCLDNHLLGLLMRRDASFEKAVCSLQTSYSLLSLKTPRAEMAQPVPELFDLQGFFLLQADFERLTLDEWFVRETVDVAGYRDIHQAIQEQIKRGLYVLVFLDRYYFPRGIEYRKRHTIHPAFLYGYDETEQLYMLVEDCVQFGKLDYYELSFQDLATSYQEVQANDPSLATVAFRLNEEKEFRYELPTDAILHNAKKLLEETEDAQLTGFAGSELLVKHTGLSCIERFGQVIGDVFPRLGDAYIHQFIPTGRPLQMQRKHLLTLQYLQQEGFFRDEQLQERFAAGYRELFSKWEMYRNRLFKYILMRDRYPELASTAINFAELQRLLHEIYPLERQMTEQFYEVLSARL